MRLWCLITVLLIFFSSCVKKPRFEGFTQHAEKYYYALHTFYADEHQKPLVDGYVKFSLKLESIDGKLIYDSALDSVNLLFYPFDSVNNGLCRLMKQLTLVEEDSVSIISGVQRMGFDSLYVTGALPDTLRFSFKVLDVMTMIEYHDQIAYIRWLSNRKVNDEVDLLNYLSLNEIDADDYVNGIYVTETKAGNGRAPQTGNDLIVGYKAYFLNGTLFDSTLGKDRLSFSLGRPGQVLKGFEAGIRSMTEGGISKFIIPSQLGFGAKGSSTGIVPPYTSLVYEVELYKIES